LTQISIRIAQSSEYEQLAALYRDWGYEAGIAAPDVVYIAELGNRVVGIVRRTLEESTTMLRGMQVDPMHQRIGVGTQLLTALVAGLADECFCIPFSHLTTFYGRAGFAVVPAARGPAFLSERVERYRNEGHKVLLMRRPADM
jgi:GNAT superfamily N-acetyltransferase